MNKSINILFVHNHIRLPWNIMENFDLGTRIIFVTDQNSEFWSEVEFKRQSLSNTNNKQYRYGHY
jgi:hypothetical protein